MHIKEKRGEQKPDSKTVRQNYADKQGDDGNGGGVKEASDAPV